MPAREFDEKRRSRQMRKSISEGSVWAQIMKETMLLYVAIGLAASTEGKLTTPTGLEEFGASVEVPLLEVIDPEGMALRRIRAEMELERLDTSNTPEERHVG